MNCQCNTCKEAEKFFTIIKQLPEEDQKWMEDFYSNVDGERLDANVNEAILDGSWPSAIDQLEASLHKAKQNKKDNEDLLWFQQECDIWQHKKVK